MHWCSWYVDSVKILAVLTPTTDNAGRWGGMDRFSERVMLQYRLKVSNHGRAHKPTRQ